MLEVKTDRDLNAGQRSIIVLDISADDKRYLEQFTHERNMDMADFIVKAAIEKAKQEEN